MSLVQSHTHPVDFCFICTSVLHQPFLTVPSILRVFPVDLLSPNSTRGAVFPCDQLFLVSSVYSSFLVKTICLLGFYTPFFWLFYFPGWSGAACRYWRKFPKLECSSWKDWCAYGEILERLSGPGLPEICAIWKEGGWDPVGMGDSTDLCLAWLMDLQGGRLVDTRGGQDEPITGLGKLWLGWLFFFFTFIIYLAVPDLGCVL